MKKQTFKLAMVYDTETTNVGEGENTRAFPILFIENDIRNVTIANYKPDCEEEQIHFYRTENDFQQRIDHYVQWGKICGVVPIITAYNLMFDLQPLMERLNERYEITANAQSTTNIYTLDLYSNEKHVLRFWDTYHLEMRGLAAMGKTCGIRKANGDWDYTLTRTPDTTLSDLEFFYAKRDVQVIPAYLAYLLHANEWMQESDFGVRIITKTSIVRQMARREIEPLKIPKQNEKNSKLDVRFSFMNLCKKELPLNYYIYALRKATFRGGYTFTSARYAMTLQRNVASLDVTSMHHDFVNGRYVPENFKVAKPQDLEIHINEVLNTTREYILDNYAKPFKCAFHARIRLTNIRLRTGSCFEEWGIALESTSKFKKMVSEGVEYSLDEKAIEAENEIRERGWHDEFKEAVFAFGKLYEAKEVILHVNEIEVWTLSRVYEWDKLEAICGESTVKFCIPPDYVTLQSNKLFEQKAVAKNVSYRYKKGIPYTGDLESIPDGIAEELRNGTCEPQFFLAWYSNTCKGMFNGIYGTQAQDVFKPDYKCENGELEIDRDTIARPENYEKKKPRSCRVLYTYGMRIVGGSRLHMVLAMELIYEKFGNKCRVLGGDTDSMKISCDDEITNEMLNNALEPLAVCSTKAINTCMQRIRNNFPQLASGLNGIGAFEIENKVHYKLHYEMWNKARVSFDGEEFHITCAGLPRPINTYTIETFMKELYASGYSPEKIITECLGFDTLIDYRIAHTLEHHKPSAHDVYENDVTDYTGKESHVCVHESTALYPSSRWIGETLKITNKTSVDYLRNKYGRDVERESTYLYRDENGNALVMRDTEEGVKEIMRGTIDYSKLVCKHIDKNMAVNENATYYCGLKRTSFESMATFCEDCPIYNQMIENGLNELIKAINFENK